MVLHIISLARIEVLILIEGYICESHYSGCPLPKNPTPTTGTTALYFTTR